MQLLVTKRFVGDFAFTRRLCLLHYANMTLRLPISFQGVKPSYLSIFPPQKTLAQHYYGYHG